MNPASRARSLALYTAQAIVVVLIAWLALKLRSYDLRVPFNYSGDSVIFLMFIQGMLLNGWTFTIPQLSAPFEMSAAAFPIMSNFDWLLMKGISLFTREPGLVLNVFWLATVVLSAASCTLAMQLLGVRRVHAFGAGVLYAFLPYALFRNVAHLNLVYYLVPLLGLLAAHIAAGLPEKRDRAIRAVGYAACVAQGFDYIYYGFFAVLLFSFAAVVGYAHTRSSRILRVAGVALALTIGSATLNLAPSFHSWFTAGKPPEMNYKYPAEAEIFGAKLRKMVAPHQANRIPGLREWGSRDVHNTYPNENENVAARMGLAASIGFVLLMLLSLRVVRPPAAAGRDALDALAPLSLATFLFITVGGLGAIFNLLFFPEIRAYNRFSVFLAFFSLAGLGVVLTQWAPRSKPANWLLLAGAGLLFVLSLYDQLLDRSALVRTQVADAEQYRVERESARRLQEIYPAGASILQLPLTGFPPLSTHERMQSYDHLRPFLWSGAGFRWSWPSFSLRHRDWQERLAAEPTEAIVDAAIYSGFDAIWVDRHAYKDAGRQLVSALQAAGATPKLEHPRYALVDLGGRKRDLLASLEAPEFQRRQKAWLELPTIAWGRGFYELERNAAGMSYRWSTRRSELILVNHSADAKAVRVALEIASQQPGTVVVSSGKAQWRLDAAAEPRRAVLEFEMPSHSKTELTFDADVQRVKAPGDPRSLYFYVTNASVTQSAAQAGAR